MGGNKRQKGNHQMVDELMVKGKEQEGINKETK